MLSKAFCQQILTKLNKIDFKRFCYVTESTLSLFTIKVTQTTEK